VLTSNNRFGAVGVGILGGMKGGNAKAVVQEPLEEEEGLDASAGGETAALTDKFRGMKFTAEPTSSMSMSSAAQAVNGTLSRKGLHRVKGFVRHPLSLQHHAKSLPTGVGLQILLRLLWPFGMKGEMVKEWEDLRKNIEIARVGEGKYVGNEENVKDRESQVTELEKERLKMVVKVRGVGVALVRLVVQKRVKEEELDMWYVDRPIFKSCYAHFSGSVQLTILALFVVSCIFSSVKLILTTFPKQMTPSAVTLKLVGLLIRAGVLNHKDRGEEGIEEVRAEEHLLDVSDEDLKGFDDDGANEESNVNVGEVKSVMGVGK
jgi:hypothetical protein